MLNYGFNCRFSCTFHKKALYLRHLIYDFAIYEIYYEVGSILRQPLFI